MVDNLRFSKRIFAMLLEKAKGDRSWRQFSIDCGISYVQMRRLAMAEQDNPPRPKLIKKIADGSYDVLLEDYMFAIGVLPIESRRMVVPPASEERRTSKPDAAPESYKSLTLKQQRMVDEFCAFLKSKNGASM